MDHSKLELLIRELMELDGRFKLGLTMFTEGAQGFHGNLRLLLDPYLFQEFEHELYELIQRCGLCLGFCMRAEATFVLISSRARKNIPKSLSTTNAKSKRPHNGKEKMVGRVHLHIQRRQSPQTTRILLDRRQICLMQRSQGSRKTPPESKSISESKNRSNTYQMCIRARKSKRKTP